MSSRKDIFVTIIVALCLVACPFVQGALASNAKEKVQKGAATLGVGKPAKNEIVVQKVRYSLESLSFAKQLTDDELMAAGQLGGQLYPTHDAAESDSKRRHNREFGVAINKWNAHQYKEAVRLFRKYAKRYPGSPWTAEAMLHIGCDARYHERYDEAEKMFTGIIKRHKDRSHQGARELVSKARLRLGVLKYLQNDLAGAKGVFAELKATSSSWRKRTYADHWLQRINLIEQDAHARLNCGVQALAAVMESQGRLDKAGEVKRIKAKSLMGQSLLELHQIAEGEGIALDARRLEISELTKISLPAIVQISAKSTNSRGHYWVLEKVDNGRLHLHDPQNRRRFTQSSAEFVAQWDGVVLAVGVNDLDLPGVKIAENEMASLYGGCCGAPASEDRLGSPDRNGTGAAGPNGEDPCGSPSWQVNMVNMNLYMHDIPMWYNAPIGPSMYISLSYNSQSSIAYYEPFGNKWQFSYATYLVEDTSGNVTVFMPDGQRNTYMPNGSGGYDEPYRVYNTLTKLSSNHFELKLPDDTIYVYNIPSGTTSMQPFLVEIRDPHSQSMYFGYNTNVQLVTITDAKSQVTQLTYNAQGLVAKVEDPFQREALFEYDSNSNLTKITDMAGYWFEFTYDSDVYLTSMTTSKGTTEFYIEPADGIQTSFNDNMYPPPGDEMWENYRITVTYPNSEKEEFFYYAGCDAYNSYGCAFSWHVKPNDYVTWQDSEHNNYVINTPKTIYQFEGIGQFGEISKIIYPDGNITDYGYETLTGDRISVTDISSTGYQYTYNSLGRVTSATDPHANVTEYIYDTNNEIDLLQIQNDLGTVTMAYNGRHQLTSITDRRNKTTQLGYNSYGQLTSVIDANNITTEYLYGTDHFLDEIKRDSLTQYLFLRDDIGRVTSQTDPTGLVLGYAYNNLDKVTGITYPDNKTESISYASCCPGTLESVTDRYGRTTSYEYDDAYNLISQTQSGRGKLRFIYDANRNLIRLIDPNNNVTRFDYDSSDRLLKKVYADGSSIKFTYDSLGRISQRTDARGIVTDYAYDSFYNLNGISYSNGTPGVTYQYDDYDRLVGITDGTGSHGFTYNLNSQVETVDGPWNSDTLTYQYDNLGRIASVQLQGGQTTSYNYDDQNRLFRVQTGASQFNYTFKSNLSPLIDRLTRPNGSYTDYQYDNINRLASIENRTGVNAPITTNGFTFGANGLIETETITHNDTMPGFTASLTSYDYNEVNQLLSSQNPPQAYAYDASGNTIRGYTVDGYSFTAIYDAESRLSSIEFVDNAAVQHKSEFTYNANGFLSIINRYENSVIQESTRIVRDGALALQERNSANAVIREYAWGQNKGGGVGGLLNTRYQGDDFSYLYDGRGNVSAVLDSSQAVAAAYRYDTFGRLKSSSGSFDQPYQFSTKRFIAESGLQYYGYRFYSPVEGRWLNKDPLGENGGVNLYGFVQNNPVNLIDPDGLIAAQIIGGGIGFVFGGVSGYISSGGDLGATVRSAAVGMGAGVLSTVGIPGAQAVLGNYGATLLSGLVMGSASGFVGNVGAQIIVEGKPLECVDYDSAFLSAAAGGLGGSLGSASTGLYTNRGLPILTNLGGKVISSSIGGISAGAYDALLHW